MLDNGAICYFCECNMLSSRYRSRSNMLGQTAFFCWTWNFT